MKIAIIDNNNGRRKKLVKKALEGIDASTIFASAEITQCEFETSEFDIALVHENNPEGKKLLREHWDAKNIRLIFFSGGMEMPIERDGDKVYVHSDELLKRLPDLQSMLGFEL